MIDETKWLISIRADGAKASRIAKRVGSDGVAPDASDEVVQAAYLRLIRRVHPDAGGAEGLAAQLNAARDTMARRGR